MIVGDKRIFTRVQESLIHPDSERVIMYLVQHFSLVAYIKIISLSSAFIRSYVTTSILHFRATRDQSITFRR